MGSFLVSSGTQLALCKYGAHSNNDDYSTGKMLVLTLAGAVSRLPVCIDELTRIHFDVEICFQEVMRWCCHVRISLT